MIISKENEKIKLYRKLSSSKKERQAQNLFVLEGERIINDNLKHIKYLFATPDFADKYENAFVIDRKIAEYISLTETPQGVFAVCEKLRQPDLNTLCSGGGNGGERDDGGDCKNSDNAKFIVLCNLQDAGNVGTIIRTAAALDITAVISCNSAEIYNPKTIRATMGAVFAIPVIEMSVDDVFEIFHENNVVTNATVLSGTNIVNADFSGKQAVFIGNEGNGLTENVITKCQRKITIDIKNIESLNASQTAAIFIWEMKK